MYAAEILTSLKMRIRLFPGNLDPASVTEHGVCKKSHVQAHSVLQITGSFTHDPPDPAALARDEAELPSDSCIHKGADPFHSQLFGIGRQSFLNRNNSHDADTHRVRRSDIKIGFKSM